MSLRNGIRKPFPSDSCSLIQSRRSGLIRGQCLQMNLVQLSLFSLDEGQILLLPVGLLTQRFESSLPRRQRGQHRLQERSPGLIEQRHDPQQNREPLFASESRASHGVTCLAF